MLENLGMVQVDFIDFNTELVHNLLTPKEWLSEKLKSAEMPPSIFWGMLIYCYRAIPAIAVLLYKGITVIAVTRFVRVKDT